MAGTGKGEVDPPILAGRIGGKRKGAGNKGSSHKAVTIDDALKSIDPVPDDYL